MLRWANSNVLAAAGPLLIGPCLVCAGTMWFMAGGGIKLVGEQGKAVCSICENISDGWADGAADTGLSWQEAQGALR